MDFLKFIILFENGKILNSLFGSKISKSQFSFENFRFGLKNHQTEILVKNSFNFEYAIFDRHILKSGIWVFFKDYETALFISGLDY